MAPTLLSHNSTGRTLEWTVHYADDPQGKAAGQGGAFQDCSQPHLQGPCRPVQRSLPGTVTLARTASARDPRPGPSTLFHSLARNE